MDRDDSDPPSDPEPVPPTERCIYLPDVSGLTWRAERLGSRTVVVAEPIDGPPESDVERARRQA